MNLYSPDYKINGEQPFRMPARNFDIAPTTAGYTFQVAFVPKDTEAEDIPDDAWLDKDTIEADEAGYVRGAVPDVWARLAGNADDAVLVMVDRNTENTL